jgi:hypothetical protein
MKLRSGLGGVVALSAEETSAGQGMQQLICTWHHLHSLFGICNKD